MRRYEITIPSAGVAADLTGFPVFINLADMPSTFWSTVSSNGGDIRCFAADGTTELPREVLNVDKVSSKGQVHVKTNLSSAASTKIILQIDGTSADYAVTATYGARAVWTAYAGVWHLNSLNDSTSSANNMSPRGTVDVGGSEGKLGRATYLPGSGGQALISDITNLGMNTSQDQYTISLWVNLEANNNRPTIFSLGDGTNESRNYLTVEDWQNSSGFRIYLQNSTAGRIVISEHAPTNEWALITLVRSGNNFKLYVNTSPISDSNLALISAVNKIAVGTAGGSAQTIYGVGEEFRLSKTALSADWVSTQYANQSNSLAFYSISEIIDSEPPITYLITPDSSHLQSDILELEFAADDPDGDAVTYQVQVTDNEGFGGGSANPILISETNLSVGNPTAYTLGFGDTTVMGQTFSGLSGVLNSFVARLTNTNGISSGYIEVAVYDNLSGTVGSNAAPTSDTPIALSDPRPFPFPADNAQNDVTFTFSGANKITLSPSTNYALAVRYVNTTYTQYMSCTVIGTASAHSGNYIAKKIGASFTTIGSVDLYMRLYVDEPDPEFVINSLSATNEGFRSLYYPSDVDPFDSNSVIGYIPYTTTGTPTKINLPEGLYYWRARAKDPSGTGTWGEWSDIYSFTVFVGENYTKTLTDQLNLADVIKKKISKRLSDTVSRVDSARKRQSKRQSDALGLLDAPVKRVTRLAVDSANSVDSMAYRTLRTLTIDDTVSAIEASVRGMGRRPTDQANTTDSARRKSGKRISDQANTSESQKKMLGRQLASIAYVADALRKTSARIAEDEVIPTDQPSIQPQPHAFDAQGVEDATRKAMSKLIQEIINTDDETSRRIWVVFSNAVTATEAMWKAVGSRHNSIVDSNDKSYRSASKRLNDTANMNDTVSKKALARLLSDLASLNDALQKVMNVLQTDETTTFEESRSAIGLLKKDLAEMLDEQSMHIHLERFESLSVGENIVRSLVKYIADEVFVTESSRFGLSLNITSDILTTDDTRKALQKLLGDEALLSDEAIETLRRLATRELLARTRRELIARDANFKADTARAVNAQDGIIKTRSAR